MKLFEMINVFGLSFTFTIFNQRQYKTVFGLIFSLISFALVIGLAFIFGDDFFFHNNPITISSKIILSEYTYWNMTKDMLVLPWRINDNNGQKADFSGLIFPFIYYQKYIKNITTNEIIDRERVRLPYSQCKQNDNFTNIDIKSYYCFDLDGLYLGGSSDADDYSYISFNLAFCGSGENFIPGGECKRNDVDKLFAITKGDNPWNFVLVYPEHSFQPKNGETPLQQNYKIHTSVLNIELKKEEYYTFQNVKMFDDQGIVITERKETSVISLYEKEDSYSYYDYDSLFEDKASTIFYLLNISMGKNYVEYSRSYMKLQEVVANVGGFIRVAMVLFRIICCFVNEILMNTSLISQFFVFEKKKVTNMIINISRFGLKVNNNNNNNNNNINNNNNNINNNGTNMMVDKSASQMNCSKLSFLNGTNPKKDNNEKVDQEFLKIVKAKKAKEKKIISKCNIIKYHWFKCCNDNTNENEKINGYSLALQAIRSRIEILNYIQVINEFQILKNILLNDPQSLSLCYMKRTNVLNSEEMGNIYHDVSTEEEKAKNLKCLYTYYNENKFLNLPIDKDYDMKLYNQLDPSIQKLISNKY